MDEEKKNKEKVEEKKPVESESGKENKEDSKEEKTEEVKKSSDKKEEKVEEKKPVEIKKTEKRKKNEAKVNAISVPISTKYSIALCKFMKGKKIEDAIEELEKVLIKKKALPMKGEFGHKKGIMSGKYPYNATKSFIKILKSLQSNSNMNDIKEPIIVEAIANFASRPRGRFGSYQRKRTHITLVSKENKKKKKENKKWKKENSSN